MGMKVTWIGNAFFIVETEKKRFFIDPWITGNTGVSLSIDDAVAMHPDCVLVSHGHPGHYGRGDSIEIANRARVPFVSTYTVTEFLRRTGKAQTNCIGLEPGTKIDLDGLSIKMLQVPHPPEPAKMMAEAAPGSPNCIFLLEYDGKTLLHVGDTLLDEQYKTIAKDYSIDLAMLPLWGAGLGFPKEQAISNISALINLLKPKHVMLHNRWDPERPAFNLFMESIKDSKNSACIVSQQVGTTIDLE